MSNHLDFCKFGRTVKYFKWPDGNHYYVSLDDKDISWNGYTKFNSMKEAIHAAKEYIRLNSI